MELLKALILVCAVDIAPADCTSDNARVVMAGPETQSSAFCGMQGQAFLAQTAIGREKADDEYMKVVCKRSRPSDRQVGARSDGEAGQRAVE